MPSVVSFVQPGVSEVFAEGGCGGGASGGLRRSLCGRTFPRGGARSISTPANSAATPVTLPSTSAGASERDDALELPPLLGRRPCADFFRGRADASQKSSGPAVGASPGMRGRSDRLRKCVTTKSSLVSTSFSHLDFPNGSNASHSFGSTSSSCLELNSKPCERSTGRHRDPCVMVSQLLPKFGAEVVPVGTAIADTVAIANTEFVDSQAFELVDSNNDRKVDRREFRAALKGGIVASPFSAPYMIAEEVASELQEWLRQEPRHAESSPQPPLAAHTDIIYSDEGEQPGWMGRPKLLRPRWPTYSSTPSSADAMVVRAGNSAATFLEATPSLTPISVAEKTFNTDSFAAPCAAATSLPAPTSGGKAALTTDNSAFSLAEEFERLEQQRRHEMLDRVSMVEALKRPFPDGSVAKGECGSMTKLLAMAEDTSGTHPAEAVSPKSQVVAPTTPKPANVSKDRGLEESRLQCYSRRKVALVNEKQEPSQSGLPASRGCPAITTALLESLGLEEQKRQQNLQRQRTLREELRKLGFVSEKQVSPPSGLQALTGSPTTAAALSESLGLEEQQRQKSLKRQSALNEELRKLLSCAPQSPELIDPPVLGTASLAPPQSIESPLVNGGSPGCPRDRRSSSVFQALAPSPRAADSKSKQAPGLLSKSAEDWHTLPSVGTWLATTVHSLEPQSRNSSPTEPCLMESQARACCWEERRRGMPVVFETWRPQSANQERSDSVGCGLRPWWHDVTLAMAASCQSIRDAAVEKVSEPGCGQSQEPKFQYRPSVATWLVGPVVGLAQARALARVSSIMSKNEELNEVVGLPDPWALHYAAREGDACAVQFLLLARVDPCVADQRGIAPLHLAAEAGHHWVIRQLLSARADPHAGTEGPTGSMCVMTAMHAAAGSGSTAAVRNLLGARASPCRPRGDGVVPLHFAAQSGHVGVTLVLLAAGASASTQGDAAYGGHSDVVAALLLAHARPDGGHTDVVRRLLAGGASCRVTSAGGFTPLHDAAYAGHIKVVQQLLHHRAQLGARSADGATAARVAVKAGHAHIVAALLRSEPVGALAAVRALRIGFISCAGSDLSKV